MYPYWDLVPVAMLYLDICVTMPTPKACAAREPENQSFTEAR